MVCCPVSTDITKKTSTRASVRNARNFASNFKVMQHQGLEVFEVSKSSMAFYSTWWTEEETMFVIQDTSTGALCEQKQINLLRFLHMAQNNHCLNLVFGTTEPQAWTQGPAVSKSNVRQPPQLARQLSPTPPPSSSLGQSGGAAAGSPSGPCGRAWQT